MVAAPSILEKPHTRAAAPSVDAWLAGWSQQGWLTMALSADSEAASLEAWLVSAIDRELGQLGAGPRPPYVGPTAKDVLQDQIYRAKMLGFQGLALALPSLTPWTHQGALTVESSHALLAWCQAAAELDAPLRLSEADAELAVFLAPVPLGQLTDLRFPVVSDPTPPVSLVQRTAPPVSDIEPAVNPSPAQESETRESAPAPESRRISSVEALAPVPINVSRRAAMRSLLEDDDADADPALANDTAHFAIGVRPGSSATEPPPVAAQPPLRERSMADVRVPSSLDVAVAPQSDAESTASPFVSPIPAVLQSPVLEPAVPQPVALEPVALEPAREANVGRDGEWSGLTDLRFEEPLVTNAASATPSLTLALDDDAFTEHVECLQTSGGSHGWEDIEALFEAHYLPLQKAVRDGAAPPLAAAILAEWAKDFAEGYERAFDAIRNQRGKRPRLVLDAPSYAFQLGRKHNAEHLKMVLVDAMRADIGPIVRDKLRLQMANTAECVASGLLWSAMPANTAAQMELIARGTDGLRHFSGELTEAQLMSRGNDLRRLRPVRVGSHRMYKLDIVQYLAKDAERHTSDNLEQYAAEVATSVGRFLRQQEPGTLVYLFGDHGFGGVTDASPEQVLTPYQAWLLTH